MPPKKFDATVPESSTPLKGVAHIFLVYGSDDLSATRKADEIAARLCPPEQQAFGMETLNPEGEEVTTDAVCAILRNTIEALLTRPFLGGNKTVYLRGAPFFNPLTEPGKFESVKTETARLVDLLKAGLPEGVSFIVLTDSVNKSTSFYKTFQSLGEVHAFDEPEKPKEVSVDFLPLVNKRLEEKGISMPPDVLICFVDRTGYSLRQVEAEIEKLSLYLGDRKTATLADIQLMVAPVRESKFYEFSDTFCTGNLANTLRVMQRMFAQGVYPVALVVNLQDRLRQIVVLSDCLKRGWARLSGGDRFRNLSWSLSPEGEALLSSLEKDPRKSNPWAIAMMAAQADRVPPARWFRWLNAAVDAQAAMTGGEAIDPEVVLELFTTRTLGELIAK
jgi:DNA polymerase-3 subunit delta